MPETNAYIIRRMTATGTFTLQSAAHFGGDPDIAIDMALLQNADGTCLIPGASIAGACRSYLRYWSGGIQQVPFMQLVEITDRTPRSQEAEALRHIFGWLNDDTAAAKNTENADWQSALIFHDAYFAAKTATGLRDGVRIDAGTGQAADSAKCDFEIIEPGSQCVSTLELVLRAAHNAPLLISLFNALLDAFRHGERRLGAKTRRGLGQGTVTDWHIHDYD